MEAEVITKVEELVRKAQGTILEIDGRKYTTTPVLDPRKKDPEPEPLILHTLGGLVGYLKENRDKLAGEKCLVHVEGPNVVGVVGPLDGFFQQRFMFAKAKSVDATLNSSQFAFGKFLPVEDMIISLQILFEDDGDGSKILRLLGSVKDEVVKTQADDGVSQTVSVKAGITFVEEALVPNPVHLHPFRTFREVAQPGSKFILRAGKDQRGIFFGLFEADGGAWKLEAVKNIAEFLRGEVGDFGLIY